MVYLLGMKPERVSEVCQRLEKLVIDLPPDPTEMGPDFLREKASLCRAYLNEVSLYRQELLVEATQMSIRLNQLQTIYDVRADDLLISSDVSSFSTIAERKAKVNSILREDKAAIDELKAQILANSMVEKIVAMRSRELDNTSADIRLQHGLIKSHLRTGAFYGDESDAVHENRGEAVGKRRQLLADFDYDVDLTLVTDIDSEKSSSADISSCELGVSEEAEGSVSLPPFEGDTPTEEPAVDEEFESFFSAKKTSDFDSMFEDD